MKLKLLSLCVGLTILLCGSVLSANFYQAADIKNLPLKFKPGTSSATVTGSVKGYTVNDYKFRASGGQTLKAKLTSKNDSLYFLVLEGAKQSEGEALAAEPRPVDLTEWQGTLPNDGEYIIRVYLYRNEARRGKVAPYSLNVTIN